MDHYLRLYGSLCRDYKDTRQTAAAKCVGVFLKHAGVFAFALLKLENVQYISRKKKIKEKNDLWTSQAFSKPTHLSQLACTKTLDRQIS